MSRIGKKVINLPSGVNFDFQKENRKIIVKGALGELETNVTRFVGFKVQDGVLEVTIENSEDKLQRAIWGTTRSILANMVEGVTNGFTKEIELNGVGFKMELGSELVLYLGFSHLVTIAIPAEIKLTLNKNLLSGTCNDKQLIGNFFANLYKLKPCDVYKHKGFKFPGKFYRKKVGKKGK